MGVARLASVASSHPLHTQYLPSFPPSSFIESILSLPTPSQEPGVRSPLSPDQREEVDQHEGAAVQPHHPPAPRQELCVWASQEEGHEDDQRSLPCPSQDHGGLWGLAIIVQKVTIVALGISKSTCLALKSIRLHLSTKPRKSCKSVVPCNFTYGILCTCVKGITHFVHFVFHIACRM